MSEHDILKLLTEVEKQQIEEGADTQTIYAIQTRRGVQWVMKAVMEFKNDNNHPSIT